MRGIVRVSLAMALVAIIAAPGWAQQRKGQGQGRGQGPGGFGMGGRGGGAMLLANPGVQKELKLTEEQTGKVQTFSREQQESMRDRFSGLRDASAEERREIMAKWEAETKKSIAAILKPEQVKRFEQIQLQNSGIAAFSDEKVVAALKLTDDQKAKMGDLTTTMMTEMRELGGGPGGGGGGGGGGFNPEAMQKRTELTKATFGKAVALLTDDQKAAWKELVGEPYEVKFEAPRRRVD